MIRPDDVVVPEAIARRLADGESTPTPQAIAGAIGALVTDGGLGPGDRLPTVRALAGHLGVSPTTVSEAWRILARHGAITTDRRRGTTIRSTRVGAAGRYWQVPVEPGTLALDLSTGTPDPALLPPLGPVLASLHAEVMVTSYNDRPVLPDLEEVLRARWPCAAEALTVVDGAQDALDRIVTAHIRLGDTVVVEDPGFPPLLDMLELAGARIVGVPVDHHGMDTAALADALREEPSAVFVQPRAHNPTGASFDAERARTVATLLEPTNALIIEDDHSGEVSGADLHSIATHLPDRVLHVRSFSKTHGPDLRVAAIGGPAAVLDPIVSRRRLGPSWTSRLTQRILLAMLTDASIEASIATAAQIYTQRRNALAAGLASAGIAPAPGAGLNLWLDVADEQRAVVALAANGIGVAPGAPFRVAGATDNIRISLGAAGEDLDRIAAAVAGAAGLAVNR
ncbi:MAG: PLP-dependent aminotransferase family protein [Acidimicrobiales bacterium]